MSDLALIQSCVKGDKRAWNEFIDRFSRLIYKYSYSVLSVKGYTFAQEHIADIYQEIFCSLIQDDYKKLRSYKGRAGCSLGSWLRQIAINSTIDYMRKIKPGISFDQEIADDFTLKDLVADNSPFVSYLLSQKERISALEECIQVLDEEDKYLIELHINRGIGLDELSPHFKVSRSAMDMRKSRLFSRLRECFKTKDVALEI